MKQHKTPARLRFGFEFSVLARHWRGVLERQLEEAGLTDATWAPLIHLAELGDGVTQKALAATVGIDGSSLVRLLDILAAKGLIERRVDTGDRRARLIYLTEPGRMAVEELRRILSKAEEPMLEGLAEEEIAAMVSLFAKLRLRLQALDATLEDEA